MMTAIEIRNDDPEADEPAWTAYGCVDGTWGYLQDSERLDDLIKLLQPYLENHGIDRITIIP